MNSTHDKLSGISSSVDPDLARIRLLALTGLVSVILLIMVGSFVRVSGHGLGCPDWPLCYGRAVPPMVYGAWVEFSHRLLGGIVGLQVAALTLLIGRDHLQDKWLWRPAALSVVVLLVQISLGGLHVVLELPRWTGLIHTAVALALAGLLATLVTVTQPALVKLPIRAPGLWQKGSLPFWSAVGAVCTYLLLLTGSLVTRTGASLACPAFPHCGVPEIPEQLQPYVTIQLIHRFAAFFVAGALLSLAYFLHHIGKEARPVRLLAAALAGLVVTQFALGISNVLLVLPMWSRVLHLGTGAAIWSLTVVVAVALNPAANFRSRHARPG
jgi:heme A synthase